MKHRIVFINLPLLAVFLVLAFTPALASSTWYVDGAHGSDHNNCKSRLHACRTIGHAISLASSGDSIMVAAATYTENLTIGFNLKVVGSCAKTTIVDGGRANTVVTISNVGARVTLSKLTIRNGLAKDGGGIYNSGGTLMINNSTVSGNSATYGGGGILNNGTLTINNSTISGNGAGGHASGQGGGIDSGGPLTINYSTISGNGAEGYDGSYGGGVANVGPLTINNSTISGNRSSCTRSECSPIGGGIYNGGTLRINNSTFSGNDAIGGKGGGIWNYSGATLQNSIVANNGAQYAGNCYGTMTSNGYNLSSDGTCNFNKSGDLNNTDPKLGQLGYYGGPTQTMPLLFGSPAIDAGNPSGCTDGKGHVLKADQRGKPRPDREDKSGCDMGAYERQSD